jgi:hypothetical protein
MNMNLKLHEKNGARAYGNDCIGCKSTKSDIMLSFGGSDNMSTLDGNNKVKGERSGVLDIFISKIQAQSLYENLKSKLEE